MSIKAVKESLNEEGIGITIPHELSTQYLSVKNQIATKITRKTQLIKAVNQVQNEIDILNKNLLAIETKAAQMQGKDVHQEERDEKEVLEVKGVRLTPKESHAKNPAFDVTPAKYISGIITEKGIIKANKEEISKIIK